MTKTKKVDRRILRTRRMLSQALLSLLLERDYPTITIQDITDTADLNRATFYLHYATKEELLVASLEQRFDELVERIEATLLISPQNPIWHLQQADRMVFEHVADYADLYKVLLGEHGMGYVINRIIDYIADVCIRTTQQSIAPDQPSAIPVEILANHVAGSLYAHVRWWLINDMPYSAEKMAAMVHSLCAQGFVPASKIDLNLPETA